MAFGPIGTLHCKQFDVFKDYFILRDPGASRGDAIFLGESLLHELKSPWELILNEPGARFSKFPVITEPVKLFCFPFQKGVSKLLKIIQ